MSDFLPFSRPTIDEATIAAVAAWWLFNEAFNPAKVVGIGVIILGVIIISRA